MDSTQRSAGASGARGKLLFLVGFALYFAALWFLWDKPVLWDKPAIYPIKVFVVLLHEISHGLAALATGGAIEKIVLDSNEGGACHCPGGNAFITLSAGYLGSLLWGVVLLEAAGSPRLPKRLLVFLLGAAVAAVSVLYVRNGFGLLFGLGFGTALMVSGKLLGPAASKVVLITLGLTSCLYAILDIKSDVLDRPHLMSDAAMLAERIPGTSTAMWGILWITIAVAVSALFFRRAYRAA